MKKIILDDSILGIDRWLPQEAIDQTVEIILHLEKIENKKPSKKKTLKLVCTWQRRNIPIAGRNVVVM